MLPLRYSDLHNHSWWNDNMTTKKCRANGQQIQTFKKYDQFVNFHIKENLKNVIPPGKVRDSLINSHFWIFLVAFSSKMPEMYEFGVLNIREFD